MWFKKQVSDPSKAFQSREGFAKVYREYWQELYGICYYQVQDEELAKEIIQNIFKSLWERRKKLEIKTTLKGYLVHAVKLEIMEHYRTKISHEEHLKLYALQQTGVNSAAGWEVEFKELNGALNSLVDGLPMQRQRVFKLSRYEGFKNHEIASELDISTKAVEYHISKALSHLRSHLQEYQRQ